MTTAEYEIPETYIEDPARALEIAYASKQERCLIFAGRLVEEALMSLPPEGDNFTESAQVAVKLKAIHDVYPEVFMHVTGYTRKDLGSDKAMLDILPDILKYGGLPLAPDEQVIARRLSIEDLEATAALKEQIAEVLLDKFPSEDFLRDFDLRELSYKHAKDPIEKVFGLLGTVSYFEERAAKEDRKTKEYLERYEEGDLASTRVQSVISELEDTSSELSAHLKNQDFEQRVKEHLNDPKISLPDLVELLRVGRALVIAGYKTKQLEAQFKFDAILSGRAAEYTSGA